MHFFVTYQASTHVTVFFIRDSEQTIHANIYNMLFFIVRQAPRDTLRVYLEMTGRDERILRFLLSSP
jgi:hypothetical protein